MLRWRVFLDANILFSASLRRGSITMLVEALKLRHEVVTCDLAIHEARRNLAHKQPLSLPGLEDVLKQVRLIPELGNPHGLELPTDDGRLLSFAICAECTHFLTGDKKHFGPFYGQRVAGVFVTSPTILVAEKGLL